jgi:branched-chain amino acid transport system permease protein
MIGFNEIILSLISGLVFASIYSVISIGLTISWGVLKMFNFSHGVLIAVGAFAAWWALLPNKPYSATGFPYPGLGSNYFVAIILVVFILFLLGALIERTSVQPLLSKPAFGTASIISTLGASIIIQNLLIVIFGGRYKILPTIWPGQLSAGFFVVSFQKIIIFIFSTLTLIFFHFFLKKTKFGMAMRAIEQDREAAQLVGINNKKMFVVTFGISAVFAGIAGLFVGNLTFITPVLGSQFLFKAFIIVVRGGLGSVKGTIAASYVIGMLEAFTGLFLGVFWTLPVEFLVMMLILILRPSGILGVKEIMR